MDIDALDVVPRLGWVDRAPITTLDAWATRLGLGALHVVRDDQLGPLYGSTKTRKLDYLLAAEPWASAPRWSSVGAIGSGHLVACAAAAELLGRQLDAYLFWEPLSPAIEANLAFIASAPSQLHYHRGRLTLAVRRAAILLKDQVDGVPVIPPGASHPIALVGMVRAGLEIAAQVHAGQIPAPDDVFLPCGTGGTTAGLALGLAAGGLRPTVHAVAVVEPLLGEQAWVERLARRTAATLRSHGVELGSEMAPIHTVRGYLGPGYGEATTASRAAAEQSGLPMEPIYSGKAWAALLGSAAQLQGRNVLFWFTPHRGDLPAHPEWRAKLPEPLRQRLDGRLFSRRALIGGAIGASAGALLLALRTSGYRLDGWRGQVLSRSEALIVAASAEVLCPAGGPSPRQVAANIDRYLVGMPDTTQIEIHGLLALIEQGTAIAGQALRFTRLGPVGRLDHLDTLNTLFQPAYRGIRDLCLLGWYQDPSTWPALGYDGPLVDRLPGPKGRYDALRAPAGALPRGRR